MKKICLIIILIVNLAIFGISAYSLYRYFSAPVKSPAPPKEIIPVQKQPAPQKKTLPAVIKIISVPSNAKVFVDGFHKGNTPSEFKIMRAKDNGVFLLSLIKENYQRWDREIRVSAGDEREFRVILQK